MRNSEHYTIADTSIVPPDVEEYRKAFLAQSWVHRTVIRFEAVIRGETVDEVVQRREFRALVRRLNVDYPGMVNTMIPALEVGFLDLIRKLSNRIGTVRTAVQACTGARSGAFLYFVLQQLDPDTERSISLARTLPSTLLKNPSLTVKEANTALRLAAHKALEANKATILEKLDPVWQSVMALRRLAEVPCGAILPPRSSTITAIPVRSVTAEMIQLHRELQFCSAHRSASALEMGFHFADTRPTRAPEAPGELWNTMDEVYRKAPLEEVIRLSLEEPRLRIAPVEAVQDWWPNLERFVMTGLDAEAVILGQRIDDLEKVLREGFSVDRDPEFWLPATLYQRSANALQRVSHAPEFRRTRALVGILAREDDVLPAANRKILLDAHVVLDQHLDELEALVGTVERPGTLGEAVRRLRNGVHDKTKLRVELTKLFTAQRPRVLTLIRESADAVVTLQSVCRTERSMILRRIPRLTAVLGDAFGEVSLRNVLDLILDRYLPLAEVLQAILAIETEAFDPLHADDQELEAAIEAASNTAQPGGLQPGS